jgi:galactokinase
MNGLSKYKSALKKLYGTDNYELQLNRYSDLVKKFIQKFGPSEYQLFSTPGRTEIGGNHTDHNLGRVLAASVNLDSIAVASPNGSKIINMYSVSYKGLFSIDLSKLEMIEIEKGSTNALIRGIAARFNQLGYNIGGFNAYVTSDVLAGSGLSSSASIEVLIGTILNLFFNDGAISPEAIAIIGQYSENRYFGKPSGLMDQTACAVGGIITIDFKDPDKPVVEKVNFDFESQNYALVVVDTGGNHADLTDDYAAVPAEMKSVAKEFSKTVCRELNLSELLDKIGPLREKTGDRAILRSLHFLLENERVVLQVKALKENNFIEFLCLVSESGNSSFKWLQNIYTTKNTREQGVTLALALTELFLKNINAGACRVHGGGFAGTIQVFLPQNVIADYINLMGPVFGKNSVLTLNIRQTGTVNIGNL